MSNDVPLKTIAHASRFELSNSHLFLCPCKVGNAEKCSALGCHDHDINTDSKRRIFNFRKKHRSPEGRNLIRFVFSDISKWLQYYDVGPLCPIILDPLFVGRCGTIPIGASLGDSLTATAQKEHSRPIQASIAHASSQ